MQQTVLAEPSILKDTEIYDEQFLNFNEPFYKISFKYPMDWVKTSPDCPIYGCAPEPGDPVASFVLPKENYSDVAVVMINVDHFVPSFNQNATAQLVIYVSGYLASLKWVGVLSPDLSISSGNITTVGGNPAWKITVPDYKGTSSMRILTINNNVSNNSSKGFEIQYFASQEEQYLKHLIAVQKMINSIEFHN
jgi:hypothetical protein